MKADQATPTDKRQGQAANGMGRGLLALSAVAAAVLFGASATAGQPATPPTAQATAPSAAQPAKWRAGRVIVQARAGLSDTEMARIGGAHQGSVQRLGGSDLFVIELPASASEVAVRQLLAHHPLLKFAELDGLVPPSLASNDPYAGSEWHLGKIGAPTAWDTATGNAVTVAVLDTGVDTAHPDLADRVVPGWNFFANTADVSDVYNHGTKVAGSAAATLGNGAGVAGVAGLAKVMPLKISDDTGIGSWSAMAQALTYAADRGVRVANISYQVGGVSSVISAAQYMKSKNGLVFVSAGNTGAEVTSAATTSLIPVASTGSTDLRSSFSTYGAYVALAAPGEGIYTTTKGGGYGAVSGTSFSSPVAAGVAALVMAANPQLSSNQVENILFSTAVDLGTAGRDIYFGNGRVNADAAVRLALSTPAVDSIAPSAALTNPLANATVSGLVAVDATASDNVGVTRVDLLVNGKLVASDLGGPFGFSWDSRTVANGMATLSAVAYDAAGNKATSASVAVNVANAVVADTQAPVVALVNPASGARVSGTVAVSANASDNNGAAGITQVLYIDGKQVASTSGGSLSYSWNTRKLAAGSHSVAVRATDAAGNSSTTTASVTR